MKLLISGLVLSLCVVATAQPPGTRKVEKSEEYTIEKEMEREVTVTRTKGNRVYMYVFDFSGSMAGLLEANKQKVRFSLDQNAGNQAFQGASLPFSGCYQSDDDLKNRVVRPTSGNQNIIWNSVKDLKADGATDLARALRVAVSFLDENSYADLLLFTDYADTCNGNVGQLIQQLQQREISVQKKEKYKVQERHIRIHVLTEATGEDKIQLKKLAAATGGKYLDSEEKQNKFLEELGAKDANVTADFRQVDETSEEVVEDGTREAEESQAARKEQRERQVQQQRAQQKKEKKK